MYNISFSSWLRQKYPNTQWNTSNLKSLNKGKTLAVKNVLIHEMPYFSQVGVYLELQQKVLLQLMNKTKRFHAKQ